MIIVIGAGPAGLAAALAASRNGTEVALIDSASRMGGQYWRHRTSVTGYRSERADLLFSKVADAESITHISEATVWSAERQGDMVKINYLQGGIENSLVGEKVILATGAYDRALPFPGWDTPGSMTPGAAQSLLKGHGVLPGQKIIVAGTGPFLLPVATGLAEAGAEIVGLFDANSPLRWLSSPRALLTNFSKFFELIYYLRALKKHGIKPQFGKSVTAFTDGVATVSRVDSRLAIAGQHSSLQADVVAVGWGFLPDLSLGGILGCAQKIDSDGTVILSVGNSQLSSQPNIWIAGEATGIGGADLSLIEGEIAGLAASNQSIPRSLLRKRARKQLFADALKRSYPVRDGWRSWLFPETTICRCEEVRLEEISDSVSELGAEDSRTAKLFTRAGMGLCQGRMCSRNVADIVSGITGCAASDAERIAGSNRPIAAPISLGQLSDGNNRL